MIIRKTVKNNPFSWIYELIYTNNHANNPEERKEPPMLNLVLPFIANMLRDAVIDKATNFGKKELEKHLDKLPKDVREAIDGAVDGDNSHGHKSLLDMVK